MSNRGFGVQGLARVNRQVGEYESIVCAMLFEIQSGGEPPHSIWSATTCRRFGFQYARGRRWYLPRILVHNESRKNSLPNLPNQPTQMAPLPQCE